MEASASSREASSREPPCEGGQGPDPWVLLWCCERCFKAERAEQLSALQVAVKDTGGEVVCFRKARFVAAWVDSDVRPPFVLVTDWREAQPCLIALGEHSGTNRPLLMAVICDSARQLRRATAWARSADVGAVGALAVCTQDRVPEDLLQGLLARCFGGRGEDPGALPDLPVEDRVGGERGEEDKRGEESRDDEGLEVELRSALERAPRAGASPAEWLSLCPPGPCPPGIAPGDVVGRVMHF